VKPLTHGSLFAGIGGFDLGFERAGIKTVWQVEIDPFCRKVLEKHWPNVQRFGDIRECCGLVSWGLTCDCGRKHHIDRPDIISGGFPCQPFSTAGRRQARDDDRYLWPEMLRIIRACRPNIVVAENVAGLAHEFDWVLEDILASLEASGYETIPPLMVPACAFGTWHRRDRVWILAHLNQGGRSAEQEQQQETRPKILHRDVAIHANPDPQGRSDIQRREENTESTGNRTPVRGTRWDSEPGVGRVVHGVRTQLDKSRVERLGNAVVPQIAEWIGRRIVEVESKLRD